MGSGIIVEKLLFCTLYAFFNILKNHKNIHGYFYGSLSKIDRLKNC